MKIKCIACDALARPVYWGAAHSPHIVDIEFLKRGLHNTPDKLREALVEKINAVKDYDYIVLVYGLCGKSTVGLSSASVPIVIPRCHDCITMFLGSRERYDDQFGRFPGTYWYSADYIERDDGSGGGLSLGAVSLDAQKEYDGYVEQYGKDNADYIMEVMGGWQKHYQRAAFIDMGIYDSSQIRAKAEEEASSRGWKFEQIAGDLILIRRLLFGEWDDKDFLTLNPGQSIHISYGNEILAAK